MPDPLNIPLIIDEIFPKSHRSSLKSVMIQVNPSRVMELVKTDYFRIPPNRILRVFFRVRKMLGKLLSIDKKPSERVLDFRIGGRVDFFTVTGFNEHEIVLHNDTNLQESAFELGVVSDGADACRFFNKTKVRMKNLKGWIYWYMILPFHHYIVWYYIRSFKELAERKHE